MTTFVVTEAFKIPVKPLRKGCRIVDTSKLDEFWEECKKFKGARGCYVFSMKAAKGELPYYVGQAAKQNFKQECFTLHKRCDHYNVILCSYKGTPYLRFVVQHKERGRWSQTAIDEVEEYLIAQAAARNSRLTNSRRLPYQSWEIRGVVASGQGAPTMAAQQFRTLMGISN